MTAIGKVAQRFIDEKLFGVLSGFEAFGVKEK
jgi:hypothetical protein